MTIMRRKCANYACSIIHTRSHKYIYHMYAQVWQDMYAHACLFQFNSWVLKGCPQRFWALASLMLACTGWGGGNCTEKWLKLKLSRVKDPSKLPPELRKLLNRCGSSPVLKLQLQELWPRAFQLRPCVGIESSLPCASSDAGGHESMEPKDEVM